MAFVIHKDDRMHPEHPDNKKKAEPAKQSEPKPEPEKPKTKEKTK